MRQVDKKNACLIGLGMITQRYTRGLSESTQLVLRAVSDINKNAISRPLYANLPFYTDYKRMIAEQKVDYAIISTPPEMHFEIASYCLEKGINVIVEKPVVLCMEQFDALEKLAKEKNLVFRTFFHWHGGRETIAFTQKYDLSKIQIIKALAKDPYCADSKSINVDRRPLMGSWIDSGVNMLSMIRLWLPFKSVEIVRTQVQRCPQTNLPVYAEVELLIDGVKTLISSDWRQGIDHKESFVKLDGRWVHIDHSGQYIDDGGVTEYGRMARMDEHYKYLFETFDGTSNVEFSRTVHQVLLKISEAL